MHCRQQSPVSYTHLDVYKRQIQAGASEETYGISGATVESLSNSTQVLSNLTEKPYRELEEMADLHSGEMEDATYLDGFNQRLKEKKSYLLVRKDQDVYKRQD